MSAVDSQLIEQLKWTAEVVCSTFHVPAWKVGVGQQPAYTKPEIADQAYYSNCLQSLIEQFELCMDEGLGLDEAKEGKTYGVELDLDGLLRMDAASQITTLKESVSGSILTVNEARRKVDQKPVEGGDSIWMQQQNYSLEALAERDRNDPFKKPEPPPVEPGPPTPTVPEPDTADEEREAVLYWKAAA
jgi:phage portal protein BeeE